MNTINTPKGHTQNDTNNKTYWLTAMGRYFNIDMRYQPMQSNNEIGRARQAMTTLIVARFGLTSPSVVSHLYRISHRQALEHLNKLVKQGLLIMVNTHRSVDGCIYICDASGAKYAEELTGIPVYFRRITPPERGVNLNTVMHDLMNSHVLLTMMREAARHDQGYYAYRGMVTEKECKRLFKNTDSRIVDGLLLEVTDTGTSTIALEVENSFKNKAQRSTILRKYVAALRAGIYDKVFLVTQSEDIFADIKRLHEQLFVELPQIKDKKTRQPILTQADADLLRRSIIFRTKYCDELTKIFY
ncbi:hypothetical protein Q4574_11090 [Aliiglaciecola sp. 3_MG-2023]|uniref:hypothetical protein n=1 Tax=Aliiglaciecola sp. 3_MG-2023 TaxID=3062644 RepID=UPI0026E11C70|nr:hypothetical protein [Aliiglaciecola sp. 3_MG-2023]MDO6693834.1 hypothetical protein [Aliiglaciecola sp. 3_MG-2023]